MNDRKEIANNAKEFAKKGFTIFEVEGKRPKKGLKWRQAPYILPSNVGDLFATWDGNYGIAPDKNQLVIDVDPRNFEPGDSPIKRLFADLSLDPKTFTKMVQTGGGGLHLFLRLPDLPDGKRLRKNHPEYKGLDFITEGAYVVGAGSTHPETKQKYKVLQDLPIAEAPRKLINILMTDQLEKKDLPALIDTVDDDQTKQRYIEFLKTTEPAIEGASGDKVTFKVACRGKELGLSPEDTHGLMAEHFNPRCAPIWSLEELQTKVRNAYEYSENPLGTANPQVDFADIPEAAKSKRDPAWRGWQHNRMTGEKKATPANIANFFINYHEMDSPLHDCLAFNEFSLDVVKIKKLPWDDATLKIPKGGIPWSDFDYQALALFLSQEYKFNVGIDKLRSTIPVVARRQKFHPIRDYLDTLVWDGVERLETWLISNSAATDTKTHRAISKLIFMQPVARAYEPGCKCDMVPILEGAQGIYKSTLVKLIGGDFYTDIIVNTDKEADTCLAMRGHWVIEMSEMITFRKKDYDSLKRFITITEDNFRAPYDALPAKHKRQSCFISTVNPDATGQYLSDPTGNRRFGPINLKDRKINIAAIAAMRDQLFAEAVHRLMVKNEKPYITDHQTVKLLEDEQARRAAIDSYADEIESYLSTREATGVSTMNIWKYCLDGNKSNLNNIARRRIVTCLRELGYDDKSVRVNGKTRNLYASKEMMEKTKVEEYVWLI